MTDSLKTCGEFGHLTKAGKPCGYKIPAGHTACLHHGTDKTAQRAMLEKAVKHRREAAIPDIVSNGFATVEDCLKVRAQVVKELTDKKVPDLRRLDMILKATTGASQDHAVRAMERQNELLLRLDGKGLGVAALQKLRESPLRVLPGRLRRIDEPAKPTDPDDTSEEPKGSA